jgi:hypothetical protein
MVDEEDREIQASFQAAQRQWIGAIRAHRLAPPDAGFSARLAALAEAAHAEAEICRTAHAKGYVWPRHRAAGSEPPHELRPDSTSQLWWLATSTGVNPVWSARPPTPQRAPLAGAGHPSSDGQIVVREHERRREMQRVQAPHLMAQRELRCALHELLIDLDHAERRPLRTEGPQRGTPDG